MLPGMEEECGEGGGEMSVSKRERQSDKHIQKRKEKGERQSDRQCLYGNVLFFSELMK